MVNSFYGHYEPGLNPSEETNTGLWFIFNAGKLLINTSKNHVPSQDELDEAAIRCERRLYLGLLGDHPCYCSSTQCVVEDSSLSFRELRSLFGVLDEDEFLLAGKAAQIIHWDLTSRFCGRCGHKTEDKPDERAKVCPECGLISYPRISPAVITLVIRRAFITVADEFGLTKENAPKNPAFLDNEAMEKMRDKGAVMFGAYEGDVCIGFVAAQKAGDGTFYMERLAVLPERRHTGTGRMLMDTVFDYVRENGGTRVSIGLINENTRLKRWYVQYGFTETGLKHFDHLPFTVCFMEKPV